MRTILFAIATVTLMSANGTAQKAVAESSNSVPTSTSIEHNEVSQRFGAGLIVGEPTGISLKYFLNDKAAIDGAIGWGFHHETDLYLHSDILWHWNDFYPVPEGRLSFYLGAGVRVKFRDNDDDRLGVRLPVGVSYLLDDAPVDIFLEVAPILDFTPSTCGGFTAGIGARFWF